MTPQSFYKIFWKQYLLLEKDFLETDEFVTIDKSNFKTFSSRYTYLLLNICSEIDSIAEEYCKVLGRKPKNIVAKVRAIVTKTPRIKNERAITKYPYEVIKPAPFQAFDDKGAAEWWRNYNLVKHARAEEPSDSIPNSQLANLKSVLWALAALYILCQNLYKLLGESDLQLEPSRLFES